MAYAGTTLTIPAPAASVVEKKHPAGICASFTCDWLKKLLANKPLSNLTYTDGARVNKLVKRQKTYEKAEDLTALFKSYGLSYDADVQVPGGSVDGYFGDLPGGYYYISMKFANGFGHSLGYDAHAKAFCDPNIGVMNLNGSAFSAMVREAIGIYEDASESKLNSLYNVTVVLKE